MSYVVPSVLVYQQLAQAGGVANVTPDLKGVIIGPCYNVLNYVAGSTASLIETSALSAASAVGSMDGSTAVLTLTTQSPFVPGDTVIVPGAGPSGASLSANVLSIAGYQVTLDTRSSTAVSGVTVTKTGVISNNTVTNTFVLPGQQPGQVVDPATIQVYLNNAKIETLATQFAGASGYNTLTMGVASSPASATSGNANISGVTKASQFTVGDPVTVTGAGVTGADLVTTITAIVGTTVTVATAPGTTNANATMTKNAISNINPATSTLRIEAGDAIEIDYVNISSQAKTFTSSIVSVNSLTGPLSSLVIADMLPADLSVSTTATASAAAGAASVTVASTTGISAGDTVIVKGGAAGGADLYTVVGGASAGSLTGLNPTLGAAISTGAQIVRVTPMTLRTRKLYNNQLLPQSLNSHTNYDTSSTATTGNVVIDPLPQIAYGTVVSAAVNIAYSALRTDLSGAVQTISTPEDIPGILGEPSDLNPLALGVQMAMANTTGEISAIAVSSNDLLGFQEALDLAEGSQLYAMAPLTQDTAILELFQVHADGMSTPEMASWRVAFVSSAVPLTQNIGPYSDTLVNSNAGNNTITQVAGKYVLTASNATFMSDGVTPGDIVHVTAGTGTPGPIGTMQVTEVISNQQIAVQVTGTATAVSYYVTRNLTKAQQAAAVAGQSSTYGDKRMINVMPDICGINVGGTVKNLPGYYLACTAVGLVSGLPVQQGLTNIAVAGISNLSHSNFYFTRAQMDAMAAAGTFLFVQETQTSTPYIRHELTTDMSVLQYREVQQVKNIDFLSYYFVQIMKSFIGRWNITPDSLNTLRQTMTAGAAMLMGKKLPKIGAPLLSMKIQTLEQDKNNKDNVNAVLVCEIGVPMNYISIYLTV